MVLELDPECGRVVALVTEETKVVNITLDGETVERTIHVVVFAKMGDVYAPAFEYDEEATGSEEFGSTGCLTWLEEEDE